MAVSWYYVDGNERMGPVEESEIGSLIRQGKLDADSYIWREGFDNWEHLRNAEELARFLMAVPSDQGQPVIPSGGQEEDDISAIPLMEEQGGDRRSSSFDWSHLGDEDQVLSIKIGYDRGGDEAEYGPFTINQLKRAFQEERINEKTFIYAPGMENWMLLGDTPLFEKFSGGLPPQIEEEDRRFNSRKPFVARLFFTDQDAVFEGICRDISIGGLQVLIANFPGSVGEQVSMNVHPDNSEHCFVASGKIVRLLEGGAGFSLRFENLNEEAFGAIQNYIDHI